MIRRQEDKIDPVRSKFGKLEKEEVTVGGKAETVRDRLCEGTQAFQFPYTFGQPEVQDADCRNISGSVAVDQGRNPDRTAGTCI